MQINENFNAPNSITGARLVGVGYEAVQYGRSGNLAHVLKSGAYFLLDLADGPVARSLGQETEFGAQFDPVVDKASIAMLGAAAYVNGDIDPIVLASVGTINVSNSVATVIAKKRGVLDVHGVGTENKHSQMLMSGGAGLNVIGNNLRRTAEKRWQRAAGHVLRIAGGTTAVVSSSTLGLKATKQLWQKAFK